MDGLKMMTVLGAFQGSGGGADLSGGGTIDGDLRVDGCMSANRLTAGEITAGTGAFVSLSVGGQSLSDLISSGGGNTPQEQQEWQPLEDTDAIRNGGRYFVRGDSATYVELQNYPVCKYAQAEIALVNTRSPLNVLWP